jgi:hypothetical protein
MFSLRRVYVVFVVLLVTFTILPFASTSFAQQGDEALMKDAQAYAAAMGVDLGEAIRRLQLQDDIGSLNAALAANEADTFAGLWIQHQPTYRVVVHFTRDGEAVIQPYIEHGPLAGMVEVRIAHATLNELEAARAQAAQIAHGLSIRASSGINVLKNRAELYVLDPTEFDVALREADLQLPANVKVIKVSELPKEVTDIFGGLALTTCTSGFSVKDSGGTKGITTAGHCSNDQWYNGVKLPFVSGTTGGVYDIQWHTAPGFTVRNLVFDGTYNRYIFSVKFRANQSVGEWVCKYGMTTGYACGTIATTSQDGVNVRVDNMTVQGGDSGGPWFWNNTAYGTTISSCTLGDGTPCAIYGPVDHIYNILGLTVLTN